MSHDRRYEIVLEKFSLKVTNCLPYLISDDHSVNKKIGTIIGNMYVSFQNQNLKIYTDWSN